MDKITKKAYAISRIIIPIITLLVFLILFINEDASFMKLALIFVSISFLASFPSTIVSTKILKIGNKIKNKILKILYYLLLLPMLAIALSIITYIIIIHIYDLLPKAKDFSTNLGRAIAAISVSIIGAILILVPYVQSILVLIIKKVLKKKSK